MKTVLMNSKLLPSAIVRILLVVVLTLGWQQTSAAQTPAAMAQPESVPVIEAQDLHDLMSSKQPYFLIDVREPEEYAQGHIEGATLIPLGSLQSRLSELPKNKKIIAYCRSGRRSAQAVSLLQSNNITNAASLKGGYLEWQKP